MSRIFGPVRQLGYVVRNIEEAMIHWTKNLGIGPFFHFPNVPMRRVEYLGRPTDVQASFALANDGDMQIELIEQTNDQPSLYRDKLIQFGEVLHHTSAWTTDIERDLKRISEAGHKIIQSGWIGRNRYVYFDSAEKYPSTTVELYDISGGAQKINDLVRESAKGWNGEDPIRRWDAKVTIKEGR